MVDNTRWAAVFMVLAWIGRDMYGAIACDSFKGFIARAFHPFTR